MTYRLYVALIALAIIVFFNTASKAEIIEQGHKDNFSTYNHTGQNFTATVNGFVTTVEFDAVNTYTGEMLIYYGDSGSGITDNEGTPAYRQFVTINSTEISDPSYSIITLDEPFPVKAGSTYSIIFKGEGIFWLSWPDDGSSYPDGDRLYHFNIKDPRLDLRFRITQIPTPIPTTSEWTLLLLGLTLVGGTSILLLRRRTQAA